MTSCSGRAPVTPGDLDADAQIESTGQLAVRSIETLAPIVTALELDGAEFVTTRDLARLRSEAGIKTETKVLAKRLGDLGWLLRTHQPGVWEFAPGAHAGPIGHGNPFRDLGVAEALFKAPGLQVFAPEQPWRAAVEHLAVESVAELIAVEAAVEEHGALAGPAGRAARIVRIHARRTRPNERDRDPEPRTGAWRHVARHRCRATARWPDDEFLTPAAMRRAFELPTELPTRPSAP